MNLLKSILYSIGLYRKRCGDCRHWTAIGAIQYEGYGVCSLALNMERPVRVVVETADGVSAREGRHVLETQPDFCCRLWRLK